MILDITHAPERSTLRVELRDDLDAPIGEAEVRITVEGEAPTALRLDARGAGVLPLEDQWHGRAIRAEFHGTVYLDGSEREINMTDERAKVDLVPTLASPGSLPLDDGTQVIRVHARSSAGALGLRVRVKDEAGRVLSEGRTDALGRVHLGVAPHDLGPPGPGRLVFESDPSDLHRAASAVLPIVRTLASSIELDSPPGKVRPGQALIVRGSLSTSRGALPGETVSLELQGVPMARTVTDHEGHFRFEVTLEETDAPVLEAIVTFEGSDLGAEPSESAPFGLTVRAPFPRWPFVLLPLAFVAFIAIARRRRLDAPDEKKPRRPLRALFERPTRSLRVRVESSRGRLPIAGARLLLDGDVVTSSDAEGVLAADDLPHGEHHAEIEAEGFIRHAFALTVPLRSHQETTVTMIEAREAATRALCEVARARGAGREHIEASTHREIGRRIERARGELDDLVADVDRAYYGPVDPDEKEVREIEERSRHLQD